MKGYFLSIRRIEALGKAKVLFVRLSAGVPSCLREHFDYTLRVAGMNFGHNAQFEPKTRVRR